ncbi:oligosaccharide flippase family protein [Sulfitobacter sp. SH24]|uniref:oligosaccharide flippase family protein n=1 Tax=Sulfitobacter sp. SH24 TaxID=3421173 RepID=UPI003F5028D0
MAVVRRLRSFMAMAGGRVGRNGLLSLIQSVIGVGAYFWVMRYVVAVAGLEGVGLWSLTMGFVALVRLMDLSGASGLARMVASETNSSKAQAAYIDTCTGFIFVLYIVLSFLAYLPLRSAISGSVNSASLEVAHELLIWALLALPINIIGVSQLSAIDGLGRADIRSVVNISSFAIFGLLAAVLVPTEGILGLAYAQFAQYVTVLFFARLVLVANIPTLGIIPTRFSREAWTSSTNYGFRLQASTVPMSLFDPLTRILLARYLGLESLGIYDLSYKLAGNVRTLVQAALNPLVPEFTRLHRSSVKGAKALHSQVSIKSIRAVILSFLALVLVSPLLSLFLLEEISSNFIFCVAVFSLGWGTSSFGLITQLYARAAGVLRWSIVGQWGLLSSGIGATVWLSENDRGSITIVAMTVASAIAMGHLFAFIGETRTLSLLPLGTRQSAILTCLEIAGFIVFTSSVAFLAW